MSDQATLPAKGTFSPVVVIALTLVGAFAFAAFFTLSAFAPELTSGRDGRGHALSQSAVGFAAAVRLTRARGDNVMIGRTPGDETRLDGLVVLTPERELEAEALEEASGWTTLVILPKWAVGPDPAHRGWVSSAGPFDPRAVASALEAVAPNLTIMQDESSSRPEISDGKNAAITAGSIQHLQTISGPGITPVLMDQRGRIILAHVSREDVTPFYILADPDFLNTHGLHDLNTARAGMAILDAVRRPDDPIVFDVTLNGLGAAKSALRLAFEPPFLGATLGIAIASALLGWRAAARFGPSLPRARAIPLGKATLADNSAALIRLAGREKEMAPDYGRMLAVQSAESLTGTRRDEADSVASLDRIATTHNVTPRFSELIAQAANARNHREMLAAVKKLHAWTQEIKRAAR